MTILFVTHDIDEAIKLGHRVAVMQVGGRLAQYARPAELLARPASEFVAQFVGSDRALKRLALVTVADAPLEQAATAHVGEPTPLAWLRAGVEGGARLLVLAADERPVGWSSADLLAEGMTVTAETVAPPVLLPQATTLRDALARILEAPQPMGVVVDTDGHYQGVLTVAAIGALLRGPPRADSTGPTEVAESLASGHGGGP
jgi:osmoprotectant transport system ATP-binding protein